MKKTIATAFAASALFITPVAQASPDLCAGQVDMKDQSDGVQAGEKSIPACEEDGGTQPWNNAQTPDAVPHPDARQPLEPASNDNSTYGSKDVMTQQDEDGIQGHDNVTNSPIFVPQAHS